MCSCPCTVPAVHGLFSFPPTEVFHRFRSFFKSVSIGIYQLNHTFLRYCTDTNNTVLYRMPSSVFSVHNKFTPYHGSMSDNNYGEIIYKLRIDSGLTQKELAEKIGISSTLITDYERGKLRLHADIIIKLAEVFQVSTDEILGINKQQKSKNSDNKLRIMKRVRKIETLPPFKQKTILQIIDGYIKGEAG